MSDETSNEKPGNLEMWLASGLLDEQKAASGLRDALQQAGARIAELESALFLMLYELGACDDGCEEREAAGGGRCSYAVGLDAVGEERFEAYCRQREELAHRQVLNALARRDSTTFHKKP